MGFRDVSKEISQVGSGYHFAETPPFIEDFLGSLSRLWRALVEWFRDLFQHSGGTLDSRGMSWLLQVAVYVVAVLAIVAAAYILIRRAKSAALAAASATKGATVVEELLDAAGWQKQADKLAAQKEYKNACRAIYLSLLQHLHENEIAQFAPAKTNYEYGYMLARYPDIQKRFRELADGVEVIWFGNKTAEMDDYAIAKTNLESMISEIQQAGAAKREQAKAVMP